MIFDAVILAGGQSRRMGCDKAWLEVGGRPLVQRQIELLRGLHPRVLYLSGSAQGPLSRLGLPVLEDDFPLAGPLAGMERALAAAGGRPVLVLAVDMARMTAGCLWLLMQHCAGWRGAVPLVNGQLEPLAAVYPAAAGPLARGWLANGWHAVRAFAEVCVADRLVAVVNWPGKRRSCLANWNQPSDIRASGRPFRKYFTEH